MDIDIDDAQAVLGELKLSDGYSEGAVNRVNAAADKLADKAAKAKAAEAPRSERLAIRQEVDRLVNARAYLYSLRTPQPGDVVAGVLPIGSRN